jgi:hypothetical protein
MKSILSLLMLLLCAGALHGRSSSFRCMQLLDTLAAPVQQEARPEPALPIANRFGSSAFSNRKPARSKFDVKRETGAYSFDTLYKLWMPKAKHISVDLHGGYTYLERYTPGRAGSSTRATAPGMVCGISLGGVFRSTLHRDARQCLQRSGAVRLNADAISYGGLGHAVAATDKNAPLRSDNAGALSGRIYLDGKMVYRFRHAAFSTQCLLGVSSDAQLPSPFFMGLGLGLRLL